MKPIQKDPKTIQTSGIQDTVEFGIKGKEGLAHIFGVLRNSMYSDKILAVIREYSCNAIDAHVEGKCQDKPIKVSLPTRLEPKFKVRDYGVGLNQTDIHEVYAFYGESTKRNTNDQIGMLGLGSKSAFSYGDNFVINSFVNGKKYIYNAFIDVSKIGQISKLGEEPTKEHDGVEIVVPVKETDCDEFEDKAYDLFKHFPVKPETNKNFTYEKRSVLFEGDGWKWYSNESGQRHSHQYHSYHHRSQGSPVAVMGNIGYPIEQHNLNIEDYVTNAREERLSDLFNDNLVMEFNIGDLEMNASRESLQYTDHTRKNVIKKLQKVATEIVEAVGKRFKDCDTLFDAKCLYGSVMDYGNGLYQLRNILSKKLKWKGQAIEDDSFDANTFETGEVVLHSYEKAARSGKYRGQEAYKIDCKENTVVIENDLGHRRGILGRILDLAINQGKEVYLIQFVSPKIKNKWLKEQKFDAEFVKLSSLKKRKLVDFGYVKGSSGGTYTKDAKHSCKVFSLNEKKATSIGRWDRKQSEAWDVVDIDLDTQEGVYVVLDKFEADAPETGNRYGSGSVRAGEIIGYKQFFDAAGLKFPSTIYGFKKAVAQKALDAPKMQDFWAWLKKIVETKIETDSLIQKYVDRERIKKLFSDENNHSWVYNTKEDKGGERLKKITDKIVSEDSTYANFFNTIDEMLHKNDGAKIDAFLAMKSDIGITIDTKGYKPTHDIDKLKAEVEERYSMIPVAEGNTWCWRFEDNNTAEIVSNYINVIDVCSLSKVRHG